MRDLRIDCLLMDGWGRLLAQAGGALPAAPTQSGGAVPIFIGMLFGAFAGLLLGLLMVRLVQFAAYLTGRRIEGQGLLSLCVLLGAVLGGWLARPR